MKAIKRNAVILTVMLFVCAAVYLNWSYNKRVEDASKVEDGGSDTLEQKKEETSTGGAQTLGSVSDEGDAGLYYSVSGEKNDGGEAAGGQDAQEGGGDTGAAATGEYDGYFAQVRLERSQARDEASATLRTVADAEGASKETVDGALQAMTRMAEYAVKEAELENMIRAKGFIDAVVYLTDDSASVTVAAEGGLDKASVAKITDVVVSQTGLSADKLWVTEIK